MAWSSAAPMGTQTVTSPSTTTGSSLSSTNSGSSSSGARDVSSLVTSLPPEVLELALQELLKMSTGGTAAQQTDVANRRRVQQLVEGLVGNVSTGQAMSDAEGLMAQQMQASLERNMPTIQRAIEGAGTSASSMQALLGQKLATDSAQAAGALGAEQAKSYANNRSQLASVLEALTRPNNQVNDAFTQLVNALKGGQVSSQVSEKTSGTSSQTGASSGSSVQQNSGGTVTTTPLDSGGGGGDFLSGLLSSLSQPAPASALYAGNNGGASQSAGASNYSYAPSYSTPVNEILFTPTGAGNPTSVQDTSWMDFGFGNDAYSW